MRIDVRPNAKEIGRAAAEEGAVQLRDALAQHERAAIIVATGASQFEMLAVLVELPGIDWPRVTGFHLDEYIGMSASHPASFRGYLKDRFVDKISIGEFHYVDGEGDVSAELSRLAELIRAQPVDVAFVGIGENGHLAFNDPPADFETDVPYLSVDLDEACRRQQLGEGWFETLDDVPRQAISMSVRQIMKSRHIICTVPDERKAQAVKNTVEGPLTPDVPASILQQHAAITLYLDDASSSLLTQPV